MNSPIKWILGILLPVILILCVLSFGNPQWGKWVYVWQAYYLDKEIESPNSDFTGMWNDWNLKLDFRTEKEYIKGREVAKRIYVDGNLERSSFWKEDVTVDYMEGGVIVLMKHDSQQSRETIYDKKNNIDLRKKYKHLLEEFEKN